MEDQIENIEATDKNPTEAIVVGAQEFEEPKKKRIGIIGHVSVGKTALEYFPKHSNGAVLIAPNEQFKDSISMQLAIAEAKEKGIQIIHVGENNTEEEKALLLKLHDARTLHDISRPPIPELTQSFADLGDSSNKLQYLKKLNLSPEQIEYYQNAPQYRLENESQEDYKKRRMLNKLVIKFRGQL